MNISIKTLSEYLNLFLFYIISRFLLFKIYFKELIGFILIAGYLFYSYANRHGFEKTIIDSEKYFLFVGIVVVNVFTAPLFLNLNNKINEYYVFYENALFDYLKKQLPTPIRYVFNIFYFALLIASFPILFIYFGLWLLYLPALIWSYLYVYLLMTKVFEIFPYEYFLNEYSFKGFSHYF